MKEILQAFLLNFSMIVVFAFIYFYMPDGSFKCLDSNDCNRKLLDYFIFSAAAHVPTGITNIYPQTDFAKYILLLQEFSIISLNLIILYFFVFLGKEKRLIKQHLRSIYS
uniref:Potassium channel domain-containing protein n=1 Tax=viral metagenome TaxID=1070528 RepID=A0A6C0BA45_9ZZZZ